MIGQSKDVCKMKKQVGYSLIAISVLKAAFIFYERFVGHSIPMVEDAGYVLLALMGVLLVFTNVHKKIACFTWQVYQKVELGIIDALNYALAGLTVSISSAFRKTHTGILSHNLIAVQLGGVILLLVFLILGGFI